MLHEGIVMQTDAHFPQPFEGLPRPAAGTPSEKKVAHEKYSVTMPAKSQEKIRDIKSSFERAIKSLSKDLKHLSETWEGLQSLPEDRGETLISQTSGNITALKEQLRRAKQDLTSLGEGVGRAEFVRMSQQYGVLESHLHSLEASRDEYTKLRGTLALSTARNAQQVCQELSRLSHHKQQLSDTFSTQQGTDQLLGQLDKLRKMQDEIREQMAQNPIVGEKKILSEALELIQGTISAVRKRIESYNFHPSKMDKTAFEKKKELIESTLNLLSDRKPHSILRQTFFGRIIHRHQLEKLEKTLDVLAKQTLELADNVAKGNASESEISLLENLESRLEKTKKRYESLTITIGRKASPEQFRERAILQASISLLENQIAGLGEVLREKSEVTKGSAEVTTLIGKSLAAKGTERATVFYEACEKLNALKKQLQEIPPKNSFAQKILQSKIDQLNSQLETAAATIFSLVSPSKQELEEVQCATKLASRIPLKPSEKEPVNAFLIKTMTRLVAFKLSDAEAAPLRAVVDLCLTNLSDEEKKQLPTTLLNSYQTEFGNNDEWQKGIAEANDFLKEFRTDLLKSDKGLTDLAQLEKLETKLIAMKESLPGPIYEALLVSVKELKKETPIALSSEERQVFEHLPSSPSDKQKLLVETALTKLLYLARHGADSSSQNEAMEKAKNLMNAIGFKVEYQSVFETVRKHDVMKEFPSIPTPDLRLTPELPLPTPYERLGQAKKYVDQIFAANKEQNPWVCLCITVESLPFTPEELGENGRKIITDYIHLRQDIALLQVNTPTLSKKDPSWDYAARLHVTFDRASASQLATEIPQESKTKISEYTGKISITSDKTRICKAVIQEAETDAKAMAAFFEARKSNQPIPTPESKKKDKDAEYFQTRIKQEADTDKKLERMNAILVPLLTEALQEKPSKNQDLVNKLPQILDQLLKIDRNFLTSNPGTLPLILKYVATQVNSPVEASTASSTDQAEIMRGILTPLLLEAISDTPARNPQLVQKLPSLLNSFLTIEPDLFTNNPEILSLLSKYVEKQTGTEDYQIYDRRNAVPTAEAAQAAKVFQGFITEVPPYEPSVEWRRKADQFLKAAAVLDNAIKANTLGVTGNPFTSAAQQALSAALQVYEDREVLADREFIATIKELEDLSANLSPEALARNGYKDFPALYQAYKEKCSYIRAFLKQNLPSDPTLDMKTKEFPHALFVSTRRSKLEYSITGTLDEAAKVSQSAYLASEEGRTRLESGTKFINEAREQLKGLSPQQQKELLFSDHFRDGLKKALGDPSPLIFDMLESELFKTIANKERSEINKLAEKLDQATEFNAEQQQQFQEYTSRVADLLLLSNIRYSGKYAQPIEEGQRSELMPGWFNPLLRDGKLQGLQKLRGFTEGHAQGMTSFLTRTQALQQNLEEFQLRVKDVSRKPPGYLEREMRSAFQGFPENAFAKSQLISGLVGDNKADPRYQQSLNFKIEKMSPPIPQEITQAQSKLREAAGKLQEYGKSILDKLSPETREKATDPLTNKAILFGGDTKLTPQMIQQLACDGKIDEVLSLLRDAAKLVEKDPVLARQIQDLYGQVVQWFSIPLRDIISSCSDPQIRELLLRQDAKFRKLSKTVE
jgi:hypothetical protein